jgi:hypothetical protein
VRACLCDYVLVFKFVCVRACVCVIEIQKRDDLGFKTILQRLLDLFNSACSINITADLVNVKVSKNTGNGPLATNTALC